jgi:hypothetical protein
VLQAVSQRLTTYLLLTPGFNNQVAFRVVLDG